MKAFISHLLQISHSQWIFRNYTLHDKQRGDLCLRARSDVLREIHELLETSPSEVPPESQYLLELDHSAMYKASYETQADGQFVGKRAPVTISAGRWGKWHMNWADNYQ